MKNLLIYYFSILLPIPLLYLVASSHDSTMFSVLLIFYVLYRGITDSQRLIEKNIINKSDRWKMLLSPLYSMRYFRELYFDI